ncbi:conserved regulator of innate immunity protein 3-like, partial [Physella acuta]|uniref:conserved regulator of innate immunity protein 3-like n=1 Tax=Physella acuta TaxID=109671 RepID=UPI0027DC48F4
KIEYEQSKGSTSLPKILGFEIVANGGDVTLTKTSGKEKFVSWSENPTDKENDPPQMICRPPFDIEISKGDGKKLVIECSFAQNDSSYIDEEASYDKSRETDQIDDKFEIREISFQDEGSTDGGYTVSASTMDAELFDLLIDMLDECGINDEFIVYLVDNCTAYENSLYTRK